MKNIARGILFCVVVFSTALIYGGQEPSGVAEINVSVKQKSGKPVVTDAQGNFTLGALPAGSYTLFVWARSAKEIQPTTGNVMVVATSYSIKIEGAKRSANQSNLNSDNLIAGVDIPIQVGPGAKVRGRVLAEGLKRFVWVPKTSDTNLPGHWAEEGAIDAVPSHNIGVIRRSDLQNPNR